MGFESPEQEPSQEDLARQYMVAYNEYREIADKRLSDLKVLDGLRDDAQSQEMIDKQQELLDSTRGEEDRAMERYSAIGERLTEETKRKYLTPGSPDYLG